MADSFLKSENWNFDFVRMKRFLCILNALLYIVTKIYKFLNFNSD